MPIPEHQLQPNMVIPRGVRRIDFPIEGVNYQIVSDLIPVDAVTPSFPVVGTSLYGEIEYAAKPVPNPFEGYVLRYIKSEKQDGDFTRMFFGPPTTAEQAAVPVRTSSYFGDHPWDPILVRLAFIEDRSFPHVTQTMTDAGVSGIRTAPRIYVREIYYPGASKGTRFIVDEFISPTPFNIPRYQTPIPTAVSYDFLGCSGSFPECLHEDIKIPAMTTALQEKLSTGATALGNALEGQFYPATNFTTWVPYVWKDTQDFKDGVWVRKRIRVYPPPLPELITS